MIRAAEHLHNVCVFLVVAVLLLEFLQSEKGCDVIKAGWGAAGIKDVLKEVRDTGCTSMNPFSL